MCPVQYRVTGGGRCGRGKWITGSELEITEAPQRTLGLWDSKRGARVHLLSPMGDGVLLVSVRLNSREV
ncbi:hypothetical protein GN956_G6397 [Arapaima gigas]